MYETLPALVSLSPDSPTQMLRQSFLILRSLMGFFALSLPPSTILISETSVPSGGAPEYRPRVQRLRTRVQRLRTRVQESSSWDPGSHPGCRHGCLEKYFESSKISAKMVLN